MKESIFFKQTIIEYNMYEMLHYFFFDFKVSFDSELSSSILSHSL